MGLPPAHAKTMSVVVNPEPRRWLSHFFCGHYVQDQKKRDSWQLVPKFHLGTQSLLKFHFPFPFLVLASVSARMKLYFPFALAFLTGSRVLE